MISEFNRIVKEIHSLLKAHSFKKKGNNFYKEYNDFGHLVNIQKSRYNSKDEINLTINVGIFDSKFWSVKHPKLELPEFPKETDCIYRERIGKFKSDIDIWYKIDENCINTRVEIIEDIKNFVLPFFDSVDNNKKLIDFIEKTKLNYAFGKLIFFCERKEFAKAKKEYSKLILKNEIEDFVKKRKKYGEFYSLIE